MKIYPSAQKVNTKIKALAVYQIAGGIFGIYLTLKLISGLSQIPTLLLSFFFIALSLYCYSIICGVLIFAKKDNQLSFSLINQYLQLISFSLFGYAFEYVSGIYLYVGTNFTDEIIFNTKIGIATWRLMYNGDNNLMEINLNLVALFVIILMNKMRKKMNDTIVNNTLEQFSN